MWSDSEQTSSSGGSWWSDAAESIFSYNGNVMLAAIISLLVVILFVLLLHLYAKWFLGQARRRRRPVSPRNLEPPASSKGLEASVIASIPVFVCEEVEGECVICLGGYEEGDVGRCLRRCGHAFHVECLDMWLHSHSNCPICRSPVLPADDDTTFLENIVIDNHHQEPTGMDASLPTPHPSSSSSCSCGSHFPPVNTKSERNLHPSTV